MKVLFIVPGSGDPFYCGNCFRDNLQANALRKAGREVVIMPLYLPLKDASFHADTPLFFPATSLYLSQKYFRKNAMPHWMEKVLNSDFSLNMAASFSGSTSAGGLEDMTLSMIRGDDDVFLRQVQVLVAWIKDHEKPDIIHLSSSLLIGIAKAIRQAGIDTPIVCSLQDEEVWIDGLRKEDADAAWEGIRRNFEYINSFVTTSQFYKQSITKRFPQLTNIEVVYPGIDTGRYACEEYPSTPVVGFFYHMNEVNGLRILADAYLKLREERRVEHLKLRIGGGFTSIDRKFLKEISRKLSPCRDDVHWCNTYSLAEHAAFYREISAICVPLTFDEGVGLYLCEAFAAGRPAIEPATGSFSEIVGQAGVLYSPNSPDALADAIEQMFTVENRWQQCRDEAITLSRTKYNNRTHAQKLYEIYNSVTK
ncbi:MAG: glycosyltransferase family 4 protein [Tannerella sp.]|jgi:glycosyltransferase involved in cell wall biosynthesis|nr:glycosyltransferase family 4 protein [Tannerella sp.]